METNIGIPCGEERVTVPSPYCIMETKFGNSRVETASQMHSIDVSGSWKREREQPK